MSEIYRRGLRARPSPWIPAPATMAAVGAGIMATTAMPPFKGTGLLIIPALALLIGSLRVATSPARTAWIFGLVHQGTLLHWLFLLGPDAPIASRTLVPAMAAGAIVYVSLFYMLFGWAWGIVRRRGGSAMALAVSTPLWTAMEALRGAGEMGFPWCLSGASILATPWIGLASAGGELALGAWTMGAASVLAGWSAAAALDDRMKTVAQASSIALLVGTLALAIGARPVSAPDDAPTFRVAAVQADVALSDKWKTDRRDSTTVPYTDLTTEAADAGAEFVVWAETAVPAYLRVPSNRAMLQWVSALADTNDVHLFTGHPDVEASLDGNHRKFNGSSLFDADGVRRGGYAKHHLLPFGERMPFQRLIPALGDLDLGQAEWESGPKPTPLHAVIRGDTLSFAGLVCFESCFSGLSRHAARSGAGALVNITNDGWFGYTAGPVQHAEMARLRAAETGLPLIRCANNGRSFVTDARGRALERLGLGQRGIVVADLTPGMGATPFVRFGHWPLTVLLLVWSAASVFLFRRERDG